MSEIPQSDTSSFVFNWHLTSWKSYTSSKCHLDCIDVDSGEKNVVENGSVIEYWPDILVCGGERRFKVNRGHLHTRNHNKTDDNEDRRQAWVCFFQENVFYPNYAFFITLLRWIKTWCLSRSYKKYSFRNIWLQIVFGQTVSYVTFAVKKSDFGETVLLEMRDESEQRKWEEKRGLLGLIWETRTPEMKPVSWWDIRNIIMRMQQRLGSKGGSI
jgi:hypothetical protein